MEAVRPWLKSLSGNSKALKKEFAHPRLTVIENGKAAVYKEKEIEAVPVVLLMDRFGYVKTVDNSVYAAQQRSGRQ